MALICHGSTSTRTRADIIASWDRAFIGITAIDMVRALSGKRGEIYSLEVRDN